MNKTGDLEPATTCRVPDDTLLGIKEAAPYARRAVHIRIFESNIGLASGLLPTGKHLQNESHAQSGFESVCMLSASMIKPRDLTLPGHLDPGIGVKECSRPCGRRSFRTMDQHKNKHTRDKHTTHLEMRGADRRSSLVEACSYLHLATPPSPSPSPA